MGMKMKYSTYSTVRTFTHVKGGPRVRFVMVYATIINIRTVTVIHQEK